MSKLPPSRNPAWTQGATATRLIDGGEYLYEEPTTRGVKSVLVSVDGEALSARARMKVDNPP